MSKRVQLTILLFLFGGDLFIGGVNLRSHDLLDWLLPMLAALFFFMAAKQEIDRLYAKDK